jgi:hypothetical protein
VDCAPVAPEQFAAEWNLDPRLGLGRSREVSWSSAVMPSQSRGHA